MTASGNGVTGGNTTGITNGWMRCFHPVASAPARLVCFPHAGGSASSFHGLSAELADTVEVLVVQYPGRHDRLGDPVPTDLLELADHLVNPVLDYVDRPVGFFGHSMGATVAFEVARRLAAVDRDIHVLFASSRSAPSCPKPRTAPIEDGEILSELVLLNGIAADAINNDELLRLIMPALRADYRAVASYRYRPGPPLRCQVVVLLGRDDPLVTLDDVAGWSLHTSADTDLRVFDGGHFYLDGQRSAVASLVRQRLTQIRPPDAS